MMRKMLVVALLLIVGSVSEASAAATVAQKCSNQFQKVAVCLSYATGKAETPTKDCCESVKGIRESEPECLCYVIQQVNSGSDEIKKMGIQVAKLLQLPTACSLKNASATDCPKLLGIPAGSPEAAIFNNNASSTATPSAPAGKSAPEKASDSNGITKLGPHHAGLMATAVAVLFFTFPVVGSISNLFV
ncbi:non-specific lipid transfer protein GPI-anchored 1 [Prunus avium]|uniref:Non-specific lipid transfer protein GPI-anchored 1 n=1 Tax=Prunus avium TaxID=42229 RepID=A0A6P5TPH6_PRUAV|nr:non-specific lipid transfer protein GPI-anchored 1 [Prunus avium]